MSINSLFNAFEHVVLLKFSYSISYFFYNFSFVVASLFVVFGDTLIYHSSLPKTELTFLKYCFACVIIGYVNNYGDTIAVSFLPGTNVSIICVFKVLFKHCRRWLLCRLLWLSYMIYCFNIFLFLVALLVSSLTFMLIVVMCASITDNAYIAISCRISRYND